MFPLVYTSQYVVNAFWFHIKTNRVVFNVFHQGIFPTSILVIIGFQRSLSDLTVASGQDDASKVNISDIGRTGKLFFYFFQAN